MQVSRGHAVFVCQGETFKTKKHQWLLELWGILPLYYWYVWIVSDPKKDWIFCARFSSEPGLPHWAQANNPRNWGSQRCPKIHWRHRSAFKSHKCKRPKLSFCVEVIDRVPYTICWSNVRFDQLIAGLCLLSLWARRRWLVVYLEARAWKTRGTLAACHPYLEHTSGFHHWKLHFISISYI